MGQVPRKRRRRTSHLKDVPQSRELRETIRGRSVQIAARLDKTHPLGKEEMESVARRLLKDLNLPEGYVGWTMVMLASEFWRDQVAATPPERRLLLLPHCLKHAEGCPADYDEFGLDCRSCGACRIADFRGEAEQLGYKVLVAEGSPIVLKIIIGGYVDAILGVACLNVLEKAIDKILLAGIPCMAVPLLSSDCRNTSVDEDWVADMIRVRQETPSAKTQTYMHLMRAAGNMFTPDAIHRLAPRVRGQKWLTDPSDDGNGSIDPIAATEAIAYDFLIKGGKHSRPFITLAAYDAMRGGACTAADGQERVAELPDAILRTALSIETFHKASLVHDDIEDDDSFRYGDATIHRAFGMPTAINVGDYLIGMGYRLVSRDVNQLGADVAADILDRLADAHIRLSEGQGAELMWRDARDKRLTPIDALKIYALKTAPAFEAALFAGVRLAGSADSYAEPIRSLAKHLGIAFQILNDLGDWQGDQDNKLSAGGDVLGGRPTILWALALDTLEEDDQEKLTSLIAEQDDSASRLASVRRLYQKADVFNKAYRLVDKYQERAEEVADAFEPQELRRLSYYLIDTILQRSEPAGEPAVMMPSLGEN